MAALLFHSYSTLHAPEQGPLNDWWASIYIMLHHQRLQMLMQILMQKLCSTHMVLMLWWREVSIGTLNRLRLHSPVHCVFWHCLSSSWSLSTTALNPLVDLMLWQITVYVATEAKCKRKSSKTIKNNNSVEGQQTSRHRGNSAAHK